MKCPTCEGAMWFEGPYRDFDCGMESIRLRCTNPHHDIYSDRRIPSLPEERKFEWNKAHGNSGSNGGKKVRKIKCQLCGKEEIIQCYSHTKYPHIQCRNEARRIKIREYRAMCGR